MPATRSTLRILAATAALLSLSCGVRLERPPIECSYRPSLVGAGNIVRLENRTNVPLRGLAVEIRSAAGEVGYEQAELGGFEVLELGWKKLGGYEIPDDATIEVRAQGHLLALECELAASEQRGDGAPV